MNYTYGKLIQGDEFSAAFHNAKILEIRRHGKNAEEVAYHQNQVEYFEDEIARYRLQQMACADEIVLVK